MYAPSKVNCSLSDLAPTVTPPIVHTLKTVRPIKINIEINGENRAGKEHNRYIKDETSLLSPSFLLER
uniref:Uncharacterized protein n=1 Tax=Enterobacter hormaechei subsp. xiangfangensis TaxID=1296536 RepID=A0A5S9M3X1_9ENTR|nr:hypothetical protein [Enterobacter hormaechei subsp. xiangfangensis]BBP50231.1 hypothetical protein [Enterobacter hormaechei subsp. xiangfangensis]